MYHEEYISMGRVDLRLQTIDVSENECEDLLADGFQMIQHIRSTGRMILCRTTLDKLYAIQ